MTASPAATKQDLDALFIRVDNYLTELVEITLPPVIQKIVRETAGEIINDALQIILKRFDDLLAINVTSEPTKY